MRTRVLALLMALVVGLFAGWPAMAAPGQARAGLVAAVVHQAAEHTPVAALADVAAPLDHQAAPPADPLSELPADHWAELGASAPLAAEGAPDLPALFLLGPGAHASSATMARPRPHATASWQRLYLNVPLRPPRTPLAA